MKTITRENINLTELVDLVKKSEIDYQYCSPERVLESDMRSYINEINDSFLEMNETDLSKLIDEKITADCIEFVNDQRENYGSVEQAVLAYIGSDLCHEVVKNFVYTTVTFNVI